MGDFSRIRRGRLKVCLEWLLIVALSLSVPPLLFVAFVGAMAEAGGKQPNVPLAFSAMALAFGAVALAFQRLRVVWRRRGK